MGTTPVETVQKALWVLNDELGGYFDEPALWGFYNDGQREIALQVPEASAVRSTLATSGDTPTLVVGVEQSIPTTSHFLIDIPCNTGGGVIERVDRRWLDKHLPGWRSATGETTIKCFCYDPKEGRRKFQTYPAVASGASIQCISSAMPDDSSYESNTMQVDQAYANGLLDYVLFRGFNRLIGNPTFMNRAQAHLTSFFLACGKGANSPLLLNNPELGLQGV